MLYSCTHMATVGFKGLMLGDSCVLVLLSMEHEVGPAVTQQFSVVSIGQKTAHGGGCST